MLHKVRHELNTYGATLHRILARGWGQKGDCRRPRRVTLKPWGLFQSHVLIFLSADGQWMVAKSLVLYRSRCLCLLFQLVWLTSREGKVRVDRHWRMYTRSNSTSCSSGTSTSATCSKISGTCTWNSMFITARILLYWITHNKWHS